MSNEIKNNGNNSEKSTVSNYQPSVYISWLQEILKLIEQYGVWKIFKALFVLAFASYFIYLTFNPEVIVDKINQYQIEKHDASIAYRLKIDPAVRLDLKDFISETGADRAFLIEFHNGTTNVNGLQFLFGDMHYEEIKGETMHVDEEYQSITLSRYPFFSYLIKNGQWSGTIDELSEIDERLSLRFKSDGCYYVSISVVYDTKQEIGFIGASFVTSPIQNKQTLPIITNKYAQKMSILLDGAKK